MFLFCFQLHNHQNLSQVSIALLKIRRIPHGNTRKVKLVVGTLKYTARYPATGAVINRWTA